MDLQILIEAINQNTEVSKRLLAAFEAQHTTATKNFYTPEEAAAKLGFKVTKTASHTRRLKYCREHGFLTIWYSTRPYHYCKKQVDGLAEKMAVGKVLLPKTL